MFFLLKFDNILAILSLRRVMMRVFRFRALLEIETNFPLFASEASKKQYNTKNNQVKVAFFRVFILSQNSLLLQSDDILLRGYLKVENLVIQRFTNNKNSFSHAKKSHN
jgi:hypothetical protein